MEILPGIPLGGLGLPRVAPTDPKVDPGRSLPHYSVSILSSWDAERPHSAALENFFRRLVWQQRVPRTLDSNGAHERFTFLGFAAGVCVYLFFFRLL